MHDFVKLSMSASLKSFLLIMCIDAPESTTNSRSSSLRLDAGKHLFSEGEKNVALSCSFNFDTLWASFHSASRAPCSCHTVSSWDRSSNFGALGLRPWGSPGQIYLSEGFWSRIFVWRAIAFVNFTRWIGFSMWNTQPNCRVSDDRRWEDLRSNLTCCHLSHQVALVLVTLVVNRSSFMPITLLHHSYSTFCHHSFRTFY